MISLEQITGEIAVLEEEKPTHVVMQKLAALYIVRDHLVMGTQPATPVMVSNEVIPTLDINSPFMHAIYGKRASDVLPVINELVETVQVLNVNLYEGFMRKIP